MTLTIGYSPCPNDTFIFDALVHNKIDTQGIQFQPYIADVEELNQMALQQQLHITKLSYHAYAHCLPHYVLLDSGSALGNNCGPLLISKRTVKSTEVENLKVAIPGKYTTANFLLSMAFPMLQHKVEMLFSDIEQAVLDDTVDAGLIIHENRFTYQEKGLQKIIDLGEFWENQQQHPIPLGGIVVQRQLEAPLQQKINQLLHQSIAYAFANPSASANYIAQHAQEMDAAVCQQHIALYVNDYTLNLGQKGRAAIQRMFDIAWQKEIIPISDKSLFLS